MQWETVRIFISSTFNDMHAERDYLVKNVFPELAEWCEARRLRLVDIDLRWGVTTSDSEANNTVLACMKNIDESRPFFLCFLGQRRGWIPGPQEVSADTLESYPGVKPYIGCASVTEMEIEHALLSPMQRIVNSRADTPAPAHHALFFFRNNPFEGGLEEPLRMVYTNAAEDDPLLADRALEAFKDKVRQNWQYVTEYACDWDRQLLSPELLAENEAAAAGRLTRFRTDGVPLKDVILAQLKAEIEKAFPEREPTGTQSELAKELEQQEQFLQISNEGFIERRGDFDAFYAYLQSGEARPMAVTAHAGMGKTSLLAHFISRFERNARINETLHYRFAGVSDGATGADKILRSILEELQSIGKISGEIPSENQEMRSNLKSLLAQAGGAGPTVVIIDAINQLEGGMSDLAWIPKNLPENVKLIVSFKLGDSKAEKYYKDVRDRNLMLVHDLRSFEELEERKKLVDQYLSSYLKALDDERIQTLITLDGAENPLFLKTILSELRVFGSHKNLGRLIQTRFGCTPQAAFEAVLERMESDSAYTKVNAPQLVAYVFGLLSHSASGLTVSELCDILATEGAAQNTADAEDAVYTVLRQLRPYLARRDGRVDFFYESFLLAARQRYEGRHPYAKPRAGWHAILADYFEKRPAGDRHALMELAYQYAHAGMGAQLQALLWDYEYMERRLQAFDIYALVGDYNLVSLPQAGVDERQREALYLLQNGLSISEERLLHDKDQLAQQLFGRFVEVKRPEVLALLERIRRTKRGGWLRPVGTCFGAAGGGLVRSYADIGGLVRYAADDNYAFAVSKDGAVVADLESGGIVRRFEGRFFQPDAAMEKYLLCGNENCNRDSYKDWLCLYDMQTGEKLVEFDAELAIEKGIILADMKFTFSSDGCYVAGVGNHSMGFHNSPPPGYVIIWDASNGRTLCCEKAQIAKTMSFVNMNRAGTKAVTGGFGYSILHETYTCKLWDVRLDGRRARISLAHEIPYGDAVDVFCAAFVDGTDWILVGGKKSNILMWDARAKKPVRTFEGHSDAVRDIKILRDGKTFVSASDDGMIKVWDIGTGNCMKTLSGHTAGVGSVDLNGEESELISAGGDGLRIWDFTKQQSDLPLLPQGDDWAKGSIVQSPDGAKTFCASSIYDLSSRGKLQCYDTKTGIPGDEISYTGRIDHIGFSRNGKWLFTSSIGFSTRAMSHVPPPHFIHLYDAMTLELASKWEIPKTFYARSFDISDDGKRLAAADRKGTISVYDTRTGRVFLNLENTAADVAREFGLGDDAQEKGPGQFLDVCISPDGDYVYAAYMDDVIKKWEMPFGKCVQTSYGESIIMPHQKWYQSMEDDEDFLCLSDDGNYILHSEQLHVYAMFEDGREPADDLVLPYPTRSGDGNWFVGLQDANGRGDVCVWDSRTGEYVSRFVSGSGFRSIAFSPEGGHLVALGGNRLYFLKLEG